MCDDLVVIKTAVWKSPAVGPSIAPNLIEMFGVCPRCGNGRFKLNGNYKVKDTKRQMYECKACGKQTNLDPDNRTIPAVVRDIIDKLFAEGIRVSVVHRVTDVSRSWLYARHKKITAQEQQ